MDQSVFEQEMAQERRARLSAERRLEQKERELRAANRQLSAHALSLSSQVIDQRKTVEILEGENTKFSEDLERVTQKAVSIEKLLWNALESMRDGFALFDENHRLIAANRNFLSITEGTNGFQTGSDIEEVLDYCLDEGVVDLQGEDEDIWFDRMLTRWDDETIEPITLKFWNGQYVKIVDRRTSEGGVVSLVLDITDVVTREEELREARDSAEAADRAKSAFLAKMSHELRTPMNGVVGMAELLLEGEADDERRLFASTIKSSGEALLDIINDVLDFSKIEAEKLALKPKPFDLERVMREVALMVEPLVNQKKLKFHVDYDQFLPKAFVADPGRMRQVMTNLVGNAVKFTEDGHVLIRVVGIPSDDGESCQLTITVEDSGIGIDQNMTDHIFGEFNQIEDESNRKYEGTGLGLAISRRLIEQMGGEVWLESIKGEGSCFGFKMKLPTAQAVLGSPEPVACSFKSAVIVERNLLDAQILSRQLNLLDVRTEIVADIAQADRIIEDASPCLVFLSQEVELEQKPDCPLIHIVSDPERAPKGYVLEKPLLRKSLGQILDQVATDMIPDDAGDSQVDLADHAPSSKPERLREKLLVLAAEDNKTNQLVFRKMLKDQDIELVMVENGLLAVDAFAKLRPDIIFMDISMPEMDGLEATAQIRKAEKEQDLQRVPIVAMTAHALDGDEDRIVAAGLDHYMSKPLKKALICEKIQKVQEELFGVATPA